MQRATSFSKSQQACNCHARGLIPQKKLNAPTNKAAQAAQVSGCRTRWIQQAPGQQCTAGAGYAADHSSGSVHGTDPRAAAPARARRCQSHLPANQACLDCRSYPQALALATGNIQKTARLTLALCLNPRQHRARLPFTVIERISHISAASAQVSVRRTSSPGDRPQMTAQRKACTRCRRRRTRVGRH